MEACRPFRRRSGAWSALYGMADLFVGCRPRSSWCPLDATAAVQMVPRPLDATAARHADGPGARTLAGRSARWTRRARVKPAMATKFFCAAWLGLGLVCVCVPGQDDRHWVVSRLGWDGWYLYTSPSTCKFLAPCLQTIDRGSPSSEEVRAAKKQLQAIQKANHQVVSRAELRLPRNALQKAAVDSQEAERKRNKRARPLSPQPGS